MKLSIHFHKLDFWFTSSSTPPAGRILGLSRTIEIVLFRLELGWWKWRWVRVRFRKVENKSTTNMNALRKMEILILGIMKPSVGIMIAEGIRMEWIEDVGCCWCITTSSISIFCGYIRPQKCHGSEDLWFSYNLSRAGELRERQQRCERVNEWLLIYIFRSRPKEWYLFHSLLLCFYVFLF